MIASHSSSALRKHLDAKSPDAGLLLCLVAQTLDKLSRYLTIYVTNIAVPLA